MALLRTTLPEARLLIAGKPWMDWIPIQEMMERHRLHEHILTHLKYIDNAQVGRYFTAADLVILPYHHFDSQSGIGAAALAFSKPMIVTETGGLPELVRDRRWVVPPGNASRLAEAMDHCLRNRKLLEQMSKETETIRQAMSWTHIAERTVQLYQDLCP